MIANHSQDHNDTRGYLQVDGGPGDADFSAIHSPTCCLSQRRAVRRRMRLSGPVSEPRASLR